MFDITKAEIKELLGLDSNDDTYDDKIDNFIERIENTVVKNYNVSYGSERTEYYDGDGTDTLIVKHRPIMSVSTLNDDPDQDYASGDDISSDDYTIYKESGIIVLDNYSFTKSHRNVKITYKAGYNSDDADYDDVPVDLEWNITKIIAGEFMAMQIGVNSVTNTDAERNRALALKKEGYAYLDKNYNRYAKLRMST